VPWMFHLMAVHGALAAEISYETDRSRFIGRGRTVVDPQAMQSGARLSDSQGSVLDPIRRDPAADHARCRRFSRPSISSPAWARHATDVWHWSINTRTGGWPIVSSIWPGPTARWHCDRSTPAKTDAQLYGRLAGAILYANASLRADPTWSRRTAAGSPACGLFHFWRSAHRLAQDRGSGQHRAGPSVGAGPRVLRRRGLKVDLVIWNEDHSGYRQVLHDQIMGLIAAAGESNVTDRPGGIFVRPADQSPTRIASWCRPWRAWF